MVNCYLFVLLFVTITSSAANPKLSKTQIKLTGHMDIVDTYNGIITESKDELQKNFERLTRIYNWGISQGVQTTLTNLNPEYATSILPQMKEIAENLRKSNAGKRDEVTKELADLKDSYANVSKTSDEIFESFVKAVESMAYNDVENFNSRFKEFDVVSEIKKLHLVFEKTAIKENAGVVGSITFYGYHLAALEMVRSGLYTTIYGADLEKTALEYAQEISKVSSALAHLFKEVNAILQEDMFNHH